VVVTDFWSSWCKILKVLIPTNENCHQLQPEKKKKSGLFPKTGKKQNIIF